MSKWFNRGVVVAAALVVGFGAYFGTNKAMEMAFAKGMNAAVSVCYQMPGVWANNETGEVIICGPLDKIPDSQMEELNKQGKA